MVPLERHGTSSLSGEVSSVSVEGRGSRVVDDVRAVGELVAHDRLFALYDRMLGPIEIHDVLREVAEVVRREVGAERASVFLVDRATGELVSAAVLGNVARTIRVPIRESSLAGYCAMSGRSFLVPDAYGDLRGIDPKLSFDSTWDEVNEFRTRDVMCAPAVFKGEVMGVVQVINGEERPFNSGDLIPLKTVSRLIGYALYHARLFDDLSSMQQLEKEKAQFMMVMVHELKSPIAAARTMASALQEHEEMHPDIATRLDRMVTRLDGMIDLVVDLLQLAKVKSGEPLGEIGEIDLGAETVAGCGDYREQADHKGLSFDVMVPDEPVKVRFDAKGYRLVLSNLVSNAVKYTQEGTVEVVVGVEAAWAVLKVKDSGIGIPEKEVSKLFTEFFRASNAKAKRIMGSGVGLAGAKRLVERFGGEFSLESKENEGSTFAVRLPRIN